MSNLKENAFAYSMLGLGIVFLAGCWFFIWQPLQAIGGDRLGSTVAKLKKRVKDGDELPREQLLESRKKQGELDTAALERAESFYEERAKRFRSFEGSEALPDPGRFGTVYQDKISGLVATYRAKHKIVLAEDEKPETIPPQVTMVDRDKINNSPEATIPVANKQLKIVVAVFETLDTLNLGGLQSIDFAPQRRSVDPRNLPDSSYDYGYVRADVTIKLRYRDIESFLAELSKNDDVPFMEPLSLSVAKDPDSVAKFIKITQIRAFPDAATAAEGDFEKYIPEPRVQATMTLRALDFKGRKPPAEPSKKKP